MRRKKVAPIQCNCTLTLGLSWRASICKVALYRAPLQGTLLQILRTIAGQICSGQSRKACGLKPWLEGPYQTTYSPHLMAMAAPYSRMQQAQPGFHLPAMAYTNICAKRWWSQALGRGKVTGRVFGSRASPWHQNAHDISSIYSLAIICELFGFFLTFPCCSFLFFPNFIK